MRQASIISLLLLFTIHPLNAAIFLVEPDGSGDFPTIQETLDQAVSGDVIELGDGIFTGDGNRDLDFLGQDLIVRSAGGSAVACIIDAQGSEGNVHRCFHLFRGESASSAIENITITGGRSGEEGSGNTPGGGIWLQGANTSIRGCIFRQNYSGWGGGGLSVGSGVLVSDCLFQDNIAREGGGLNSTASGSPHIICCRFVNNTAMLGGGFYAHINSTPYFSGCRFEGNIASDGGGGLYIRSCPHSISVAGCIFVQNRGEDGGGVAIYDSVFLNLEYCTFYANTATRSIGDKGSAICSYGTQVSATNCIIAFSEGGEATYGQVFIDCCDVFGNSGGDGSIETQIGNQGNIALDPLFCLLWNPDDPYALRSDSPCAAQNNPDCGQIGALPVGCVVTATEPRSWGSVKVMY